MHRLALWCRAANCAAIAIFLLLGNNPAQAQSASEVNRYDQQATAEYNRGLDASDEGRNGAACEHFRNAEVLYHNSTVSLIGLPMQTAEQREEITNYADRQQASLNDAKAHAKEVCGRPDGPALTSSSSGSTADDVDTNYADKKELQRLADLAHSQYKESVRLWEAGDEAGACAAARRSVASFATVVSTLRANPALESAFANPAQIYANAQQAMIDRDEFYCARP